MHRIELHLPWSRGMARVDGRRIVSGIIFVTKDELRRRDASAGYGRNESIYNLFIHGSRLGVFNRIFVGLAAKGGKLDQMMIDDAYRTEANLLRKRLLPDVSAGSRTV